ncbi:MAG: hypothetical protein ACERKN_21785 [Velocimicrobium sp.]
MSQLDKSIFKRFIIIEVKKRFLGIVKLYKISIPEADIQEAVISIQANMSNKFKKEWYATFYNSEKIIIVFRQKKFELFASGIIPVYQTLLDTTNAVDKRRWDEMISYAKSLGIPERQLDFLPLNFNKETY